MSVSARKSRQLDKVLQLLLPKSCKVLQSISVLQSVTTPPPPLTETQLPVSVSGSAIMLFQRWQLRKVLPLSRVHVSISRSEPLKPITLSPPQLHLAFMYLCVAVCKCLHYNHWCPISATLTHSLHWWTIIAAAVGKSPHMRVRGQHL